MEIFTSANSMKWKNKILPDAGPKNAIELPAKSTRLLIVTMPIAY